MDTSRMEDTIRRTLEKIGKGDVFAVVSEETPVVFKSNRLQSVEDHSRFAVGLRVFENGRIGNSYANSHDGVDELVRSARQSAELGETLDFDLPKPAYYPRLGLSRPETAAYSKERAVELGERIVSEISKWDDRLQAEVEISTSRSRTYIANTEGVFHSYEETDFSAGVSIELVEDDESLLLLGDGDSDYGTNVELDRILERLEWHYRNTRSRAGAETGYMDVVFAPECVDTLLEPIEIAASGKTLFKGMSLFEGKADERIAAESFTLTDDPFDLRCSACYPVDDEGIVPEQMKIVDKGIFRNFIYDLATAKRMNALPTGHGSRSVSSLPGPSFSNLVVSEGGTSFGDMVKSIDNGVYVVQTLGAGQSNVTAGDLSFNLDLAYRIEKGKITGRVKDAMVSGNVFDWLGNIAAVGNESRRLGSLLTPAVWIRNVSITG